jgi:hypothetical protein
VSSRLLLTLAGAVLALGPLSAQPVPRSQQGGAGTDLDAFMSRVLERRDDNWKKLQQYVLEERETVQLTGPGARPIWGTQREYLWFPRDGVFIKSPLKADGVTVSEADRRKAEDEWIHREERRKERQKKGTVSVGIGTGGIKVEHHDGVSDDTTVTNEESIRDALEPGFVSAAYFLKFKFDPGQYALAGRETLEGRNVLRIEYYPTKLFKEGRERPNRQVRKRDEQIEEKMNKVALVTLWVDPSEHQILKYDFLNLPLDFLPGRSILRIDGMHAAMEMGQPFPSVWLPRSIRIGIDATLAIGEVDGRYAADFYDYKLATVNTRVR